MRKKEKSMNIETYSKKIKKEIAKFEHEASLRFDQPDYSKNIKSMINEILNSEKNTKYKDVIFPDSKLSLSELIKFDSIYKRRRRIALERYLPVISNKFKDKYPNIPIERIILTANGGAVSSYPDTMFMTNGEGNSTPITIAIALHILDTLSDNDTLDEALTYLPKDKEKLDSITFSHKHFMDSVYTNDVIKGMMYIIMHRNDDDSVHVYYTHASAQRTEKSIVNQADTTDDTTYMSNRARMDKILSLIPQTAVQNAKEKFETKFFEYVGIIIDACREPLDEIFKAKRELANISARINEIETQVSQKQMNTFETMSLKHRTQMQSSQSKHCLAKPYQYDFNALVDNAMDTAKLMLGYEDHYSDEMDELHNRLERTGIRHNDNIEEYNCTLYDALNTYSCQMRYKSKCFGDKIKDFTIGSPYELLFGFFGILDNGDDLPWLVELIGGFVDHIVSYLPFIPTHSASIAQKAKSTLEEIMEQLGEETDEEIAYEYADYSKLETQLYKKRLNDYAEWVQYCINDVNGDDLRRINLPQLVFNICDVVLPRKMQTYDDDFNRVLAMSGISKKNTQLMHLFLATVDTINKRNKAAVKDTENKCDNENIISLKNSTTELTKQISELKSAVHDAEKKCRLAEEKVRQMEAETAFEHEELMQLRELVYNLQNSSDIETETVSESVDIKLPYTPKQKIVIFGGHDTWLKVIRPLLPKVRFIEPNENPDVNMIRNADVVWMQSNAMPHCFYNKIMDIARQRKIPVKYFASASAEKCAYQLAEDDMKSGNEVIK